MRLYKTFTPLLTAALFSCLSPSANVLPADNPVTIATRSPFRKQLRQPVSAPDSTDRIRFFAVDADRSAVEIQRVDLWIWYFTDELDPGELEGLSQPDADHGSSPDLRLRFDNGDGLTRSEFRKRFPQGNLIVKARFPDGIRKHGPNRYNTLWRSYHIDPDFPPQRWLFYTDIFRAGL